MDIAFRSIVKQLATIRTVGRTYGGDWIAGTVHNAASIAAVVAAGIVIVEG
jgi:hypothetical protein